MRLLAPGFVTLMFVLLPAQARSEEFRSASGRFRFQAPPNWVRFDARKLEEARRGARAKRDEILHEGFEPRGTFDLPFLLVMEVKQAVGRFQTYDMVERSLNNEFRRDFEAGAGQNIKLGPITLDRAKNRFSAPFDMTGPNGMRLRGMLYGFLGKNSFVAIACFTRDWEMAQLQPSFDTMADSFRFDPGFQYVPLDLAQVGMIAAGVGTSCCCVFALAAIVLGVLMLLMRK